LADETRDSAWASMPLLTDDERPPFFVQNAGGSSPFVLIGDHAGCSVPTRLSGLGLGPEELRRHIGWDIGVAQLGERLAVELDAVFIGQRFSRLVIDCNRDPARLDAIAEISDGTVIPANLNLSAAERRVRVGEVFEPYHDRVAEELASRAANGLPAVLVALHSFTPALNGLERPWLYGVLHLEHSAFASSVLTQLRSVLGPRLVGDNEPYAMDGTDYSVPRHAMRTDLQYVELEVRQDLLGSEDAVRSSAAVLAPVLVSALDLAR